MTKHQISNGLATSPNQLLAVVHPIPNAGWIAAARTILRNCSCVWAIVDNLKIGFLCAPQLFKFGLKYRTAGIVRHAFTGINSGKNVSISNSKRQCSGRSHGMSADIDSCFIDIVHRDDFIDRLKHSLLCEVFNDTGHRNGAIRVVVVVGGVTVPPRMNRATCSTGVIDKQLNGLPVRFRIRQKMARFAVGM